LSTKDLSTEPTALGLRIRAVLDRFASRRLDHALVAEMAEALNQELVAFRAGRRIALAFDDSDIRVDLTCEERSIKANPDAGEATSLGFDRVASALAA
jgi:hypothetical protein